MGNQKSVRYIRAGVDVFNVRHMIRFREQQAGRGDISVVMKEGDVIELTGAAADEFRAGMAEIAPHIFPSAPDGGSAARPVRRRRKEGPATGIE